MDTRRPTEEADSNGNFDEEKLIKLIHDEKWDEAIELFDRLTPQNKIAAVNNTYDERGNSTTLMRAALYRAPLTLIQYLCEISGKTLIMDTDYERNTALHDGYDSDDPNLKVA